MNGIMMIIISIVCCIFGYYINREYEDKYHEPAIRWGFFALQFIFVSGVLIEPPRNGFSGWPLFWLIGAIVTYVIALWFSKKHAENQNAEKTDVIYAMIAQAILPFGSAAVVLVILALVFSLGENRDNRKKRRR